MPATARSGCCELRSFQSKRQDLSSQQLDPLTRKLTGPYRGPVELRLRMGMDIVELVTGLEERFGVVIGNEEVSQIATVGSLATAICEARASRGLEEIRWIDVYAVMVDILQSDYGIGGHLLRPEARLVEDLGLD